MNCDAAVCQYDLFSVIKNTQSELFVTLLNQDIQDLLRRI